MVARGPNDVSAADSSHTHEIHRSNAARRADREDGAAVRERVAHLILSSRTALNDNDDVGNVAEDGAALGVACARNNLFAVDAVALALVVHNVSCAPIPIKCVSHLVDVLRYTRGAASNDRNIDQLVESVHHLHQLFDDVFARSLVVEARAPDEAYDQTRRRVHVVALEAQNTMDFDSTIAQTIHLVESHMVH